MALFKSLKTCSLLSSEIRCSQLFFPIHQSFQICGALLSQKFHTGSKDFRKFHRKPIKINPAKQDEGKMLLGDYVDSTDGSSNKEVLQETRRLAKVMQSSAGEVANAADQNHRREEEMLLRNDWERTHVAPPSENAPKKKPWAQDPVIEKALKLVKYEHLHNAPSQFRSLLSQCGSRKLRRRHDVVMLEGVKLIEEALSANVLPLAVFYSRKNLLFKMMPKAMELEEKVERLNSMSIFSMPYAKMNTWSTVVKGQGIMGAFRLSDMAQAYKLKQNSENQISKSPFPLGRHVTLVLDSVREPGNVGALIRTAAGAGIDRVVLTKGCCDPWESKALRAGCGGHLSLEVCESVPWSRIYTTVGRYPSVYLADVGNSDREPLRDQEDDEGHCDSDGLGRMNAREQREKGMRRVIRGPASMGKSLVERADEVEDGDEEASSDESEEFFGSYIEVQEDGSELLIDNSFLDAEHLNQFAHTEFPLKFINEVEFFSRYTWQSQSIVLVAGGETGLSAHARKFAHDNVGSQVSIPLHNGMDSLNTSVASGVILYEMWKQLQNVKVLSVDRAAAHVQGAASE